MNNFNNQKGFSLIELMIVVAIIGILSAIAVPNFQRFQAKSRQTEAKGNLAGYYQAAKAGFAEQGYYSGNFVAIGFNPDGSLNYRITAVDGVDPLPAGSPNNNACVNTSTTCGTYGQWSELTPTASTGPAPSVGTPAPSTTNTTFVVTASGRIGTATVDAWSMTNTKDLAINQNGLP